MTNPVVPPLDLDELIRRIKEEAVAHDASQIPPLSPLSADPGQVDGGQREAGRGGLYGWRMLLRSRGDAFLFQAYQVILGREPDEGGLHTYRQRLAAGTPRFLIIIRFLISSEGRHRMVRRLAGKPLFRRAGGMRARVAALEQGTAAVTERLAALEQGSLASIERLATLEQGSLASIERLAALEQGSLASIERLAALEQGSLASIERLAALELNSTASAERLAALEQGNLASIERFTALEQNSTASAERLAALELNGTVSAERLAALEQDSAASTERLGVLEQHGAGLTERLVAIQQSNSAAAERLAGLEQDASGVAGRLVAIEQEAARVRGFTEYLEERFDHPLRGLERRLADELSALGERFDRLDRDFDMARADLIYSRQMLSRRIAGQGQVSSPKGPRPSPESGSYQSGLADIHNDELDRYYQVFEEQFRGSRAEIKQLLEHYLDDLTKAGSIMPATPLLDLGCGRGDWLELLSEKGIPARGVDTNRSAIDLCLALCLDVEHGDALETLHRQVDNSLGAISAFHLIEHLPFPLLLALLQQAFRVLVPGGILLLETPNPENVLVGSHTFYHDPTHRNPVTPASSRFLVRYCGFSTPEIRRLHPYPDTARVPGEDPLTERLNGHFCGPQDFALIARKPGRSG